MKTTMTVRGTQPSPGRPKPGTRSLNQSKRRGASTVEFAIVAPVFFLMVLGIFEFGRGLMVMHLLADAARQGCRTAISPGKATADITAVTNNLLKNENITAQTTTVLVNSVQSDAVSAQTGDEITVTISIPVSAITCVPRNGFLSGNLMGQYTLRRQ